MHESTVNFFHWHPNLKWLKQMKDDSLEATMSSPVLHVSDTPYHIHELMSLGHLVKLHLVISVTRFTKTLLGEIQLNV